MKKTIIFICLISSLLITLDTMNAADSLILLLLAGVIPGTDIRITPIDMMAAIATAITIVVMRLTLWTALRSTLFAPVTTHTSRTKRTSRRVA
jgi:hypothetical protein